MSAASVLAFQCRGAYFDPLDAPDFPKGAGFELAKGRPEGGVHQIPTCGDCTAGQIIAKEEAEFNYPCWEANSNKPFLEVLYSCKQWNCEFGKYYYEEIGHSPNGCVANQLVNYCPDPTCLPALACSQ